MNFNLSYEYFYSQTSVLLIAQPNYNLAYHRIRITTGIILANVGGGASHGLDTIPSSLIIALNF